MVHNQLYIDTRSLITDLGSCLRLLSAVDYPLCRRLLSDWLVWKILSVCYCQVVRLICPFVCLFVCPDNFVTAITS